MKKQGKKKTKERDTLTRPRPSISSSPTPKYGVRHGPETRRRVVELYVVERMSFERIARVAGMPTPKTIMRILDDEGVERRDSTKFDREAIVKDIRENPKSSLRAIAERHGCSQTLVGTIRKNVNRRKK